MDAYASHLARLGPSHQVTAQEDICNAQGIKLLARGSRLDDGVLTKLAMQKLLKPLGESIGIGGQLDSAQLMAACAELAQEQADLPGLMALLPMAELCSTLERQPLLCQRLTVMRQVSPARFRRTLFGALLVQGMIRLGGLRGLSSSALFVAALARSIGLLHLPTELMQGEVQDSAEAQHQFESYPVISREMIRRSLDAVSAEAILDQHEHLDGSGFPRGWRAGSPRLEAQLLGLADYIAWLCLEQVGSAGRLIHALGPLRLLRPFWSAGLFEAARELLQSQGRACPPLVEEAARAVWLVDLKARQQVLAQQLQALPIPFDSAAAEASHAQRQYARLRESLDSLCVSSGLLSPEYGRWIEHVCEQQLSGVYAEMDEVHLQLCCLAPLLQRASLLQGELARTPVSVAV